MKSKLIIRLTGKACQVFAYLGLLARERGSETLGEIAKKGN